MGPSTGVLDSDGGWDLVWTMGSGVQFQVSFLLSEIEGTARS